MKNRPFYWPWKDEHCKAQGCQARGNFLAGRLAGLHEAAEICDRLQDGGINVPFRELCAKAIRAAVTVEGTK